MEPFVTVAFVKADLLITYCYFSCFVRFLRLSRPILKLYLRLLCLFFDSSDYHSVRYAYSVVRATIKHRISWVTPINFGYPCPLLFHCLEIGTDDYAGGIISYAKNGKNRRPNRPTKQMARNVAFKKFFF